MLCISISLTSIHVQKRVILDKHGLLTSDIWTLPRKRSRLSKNRQKAPYPSSLFEILSALDKGCRQSVVKILPYMSLSFPTATSFYNTNMQSHKKKIEISKLLKFILHLPFKKGFLWMDSSFSQKWTRRRKTRFSSSDEIFFLFCMQLFLPIPDWV